MSKKILLGLIGRNIQGSLSPRLHEDALQAVGLSGRYQLMDLNLSGASLRDTFRAAVAGSFCGFNVTFPHKQEIILMLDELSPEARRLGAVNTVTIDRDRRTTGYNTDHIGFIRGFEESVGRQSADGKSAVLIGAGGAGRAVAFALMELGIARLLIHDKELQRAAQLVADLKRSYGPRSETLAQPDERVSAADGVVNATPVGMRGIPGQPVPSELIGRQHWLADVIYTPTETELLKVAKSRGIATMNGGGMCVHQAAEAFRLFTGIPADVRRMRRVFEDSVAVSQSH